MIIRHGYASRDIQASRATAHWQRIRTQRLHLDGHECQFKYPGCDTIADSVHLDTRFNGDHLQVTILNTLSCCRRCHSRRGGI